MDHRLEPPKNRVSLGLHMNSYVHSKQDSQIFTISMDHKVSHEGNTYTLKQFKTIKIKHSRAKASDVE